MKIIINQKIRNRTGKLWKQLTKIINWSITPQIGDYIECLQNQTQDSLVGYVKERFFCITPDDKELEIIIDLEDREIEENEL